jgi:hypothetical protein
MSAHGNGGRYEYYACTARQKYRPEACKGDRFPRAKLEQTVLAQLANIYRDGDLIQAALAKAKHDAERRRPETEQRLRSIPRRDQPLRTGARALLRSVRAREAVARALRTAHHTPPSAPRRPPRPRRRTHPRNARQRRTPADRGRTRRRRRPSRPRHRQSRATEGQGAPTTPDRRPARQQPTPDPAHLPHRHASGLRSVREVARPGIEPGTPRFSGGPEDEDDWRDLQGLA